MGYTLNKLFYFTYKESEVVEVGLVKKNSHVSADIFSLIWQLRLKRVYFHLL